MSDSRFTTVELNLTPAQREAWSALVQRLESALLALIAEEKGYYWAGQIKDARHEAEGIANTVAHHDDIVAANQKFHTVDLCCDFIKRWRAEVDRRKGG